MTIAKPDGTIVDLIIKLENEAKQHERAASIYRYQAAEHIVRELDRGVKTRALAEAIHKSRGHPTRARGAWEMIQADSNLGPADFNDAYKMTGAPKGTPTPASWDKRLTAIKTALSNLLRDADRGQAARLAPVCSNYASRARWKARS